MAVTGSGYLKLNDTTMTYGYSQEDGGALYVANGGTSSSPAAPSPTTGLDEGGAIEQTAAYDHRQQPHRQQLAVRDGGGVSSEDGGDLTIRNGTIIRNNCACDSGGGVCKSSTTAR